MEIARGTPTTPDSLETRSWLNVVAVAPREDESGIVFRSLPGPPADPPPHLWDGVLYAAAPNLVAFFAPRIRVTVAVGRAVIDGRPTEIPAHTHGNVPYVAVRPFARRFGAYTYLSGPDSAGSIFPRDVLLAMDTTATAYRRAVREGLVP